MLVPRGEESEQDDDYEEITGSEIEFASQVSCLKFKYMLSAESFSGHFFSLLVNENTASSTLHILQLLMFFLMSDQKKKKKEMLFGFMIVVPVTSLSR